MILISKLFKHQNQQLLEILSFYFHRFDLIILRYTIVIDHLIYMISLIKNS